jgi:mannose-1-phosphate guanylyltransferase
MPPVYVVILAGGGGTRLRPLSRGDRPKPFLPLIDDRTLIQHTVERLPRSASGVWVVTDRRYSPLVRAQVPGVEILEEPEGRNTAAAIALATLAIEQPEDDVMAVLPADHVIEPDRKAVFAGVLETAASRLATGAFGINEPLVTLGIGVDRPAVEYGYLVPDVVHGDDVDGLRSYPLRAFEEKPTVARAEELMREPGVAWNAGMFVWQRRAIRNALARHTRLLSDLAPAVRSGDASALARAYGRLAVRSIDYEVMEPAGREGCVVMAAMDVGWSDIGGWSALLGALGATGSGRVVQPGEDIELASDDLLVLAEGPGLTLREGPSGTIRSETPTALLTGAAPRRDLVTALLARVAAMEAQSPGPR